MEFQLLIENGELTITDNELSYFSEALGLDDEDFAMELIAEAISELELVDADYEDGKVDLYVEDSVIDSILDEAGHSAAARRGQNRSRGVAPTPMPTSTTANPKPVSGIGIDKTGTSAPAGGTKEPTPVSGVGIDKAGVQEKVKTTMKEKIKGAAKKVGEFAGTKKGKIAIGAGAVLGAGAIAGGIAHAVKKRNARKNREDKDLNECMIDVFFNEDGSVYIDEIDMDFLLEACDYELTEEEILDNVYLEAGCSSAGHGSYHGRRRASEKLKEKINDAEKKNGKLTAKAKRAGSEAVKKVKDFAGTKKGKIAIGAGAVLGAGAIAAHAIHKHNKKKREEEEMNESVINVFYNEDGVLCVLEEDVDFLLEACDYELTEEEILDNIYLEAGRSGAGHGSYHGRAARNRQQNQVTQATTTSNPEPVSGVGIDKAGEEVKKSVKEKVKGAAGKAWKATKDFAGTKKGKIALGAGAVLGTAAVAGGIAHAVKKRNAKKREEERDRNFRESVVDILVTEDAIYMDQIDMDFLLEACDYNLSESEIMDNILMEAQDTMGHIPGQKVVITSSRELAKIEEKQLDDIPERVKDGKLGNEEIAVSTANVGKKEIQESVEYDEYAETFEGDHLIMEAILEDAGIELSEAQMQALIEANLLSERSIVRLDKAAKRTQAEKKALVVIAREQGDPLYKKLVKVYKQKNDILEKLDSKYGTRAIARVRGNARKIDKED